MPPLFSAHGPIRVFKILFQILVPTKNGSETNPPKDNPATDTAPNMILSYFSFL